MELYSVNNMVFLLSCLGSFLKQIESNPYLCENQSFYQKEQCTLVPGQTANSSLGGHSPGISTSAASQWTFIHNTIAPLIAKATIFYFQMKNLKVMINMLSAIDREPAKTDG